MKKYLVTVLSALAVFACTKAPEEILPPAEPAAVQATGAESPFVEGAVNLYLSEDMALELERDLGAENLPVTKSSPIGTALSDLGATSMHRVFPDAGEFEPRTRAEGLHRWYRVEYDRSVSRTKAGETFSALPGVIICEPVLRARIQTTLPFNDPLLPDQWAYYNDGSTKGWKAGCDLNVLPVWSGYTKGSPKVVVAVVDAGIDLNHEDLAANVISKESHNFAAKSNKITAGDHGTHVAGTIAAVNNNGIGVSGIAGGDVAAGQKGTRLISCQVFDTDAEGNSLSSGFEEAIKWGADHGAVISNNSWGYDFNTDGKYDTESAKETHEFFDHPNTGSYTNALKSAIDYFNKYAGCDNDGEQLPDSPMKGGVVFFAAGNDGKMYGPPANYEGVVAVGAVGPTGTRAYYSNYGSWVDIAAPGGDANYRQILSTLPGNEYGYMQGTSMACPHVSGVAALVVAACGGPGFTREMLVERICKGYNQNISLKGLQIGPLVDAMGAVSYGAKEIPSKVTDFSGESESNRITYRWTVTGSKNKVPAYGYFLFYGTDKSAVQNATNKKTGEGVKMKQVRTDGLSIGEKMEVRFSELLFNTTYYAKVVGFDYSLNTSEASSVISVKTKPNNPPVITPDQSIDNVRLRPFDVVNLTFSVSDPDNHSVTIEYEQGSAAETFATTSSGICTLRLVAANAEPGEYTAKIIATDQYGLSAELPVHYTLLENQPPVKIQDIGDLLLTTLNETVQLDMTQYFTDPDGEALSYEVTASDNSVVHPASQDQTLYVTTLKYGLTTLNVKAFDAKRKSAEGSFRVLVRDAAVEYQAYPNPVESTLYVATGIQPESTSIRIVSLTGVVVYEGTVTASAFEPATVNMSACAPGRYTAIISFGGKEFRQTIVKK